MSTPAIVPKGTRTLGPYSPAIQAGPFLYISGQVPLLPSGEIVEGPIEDQTRQCMENLKAILSAAGATIQHLVKVTLYLVDLEDLETVNRVYRGYFDRDPPARTCVQVSRLPKGSRIEIEAVAYLGGRPEG